MADDIHDLLDRVAQAKQKPSIPADRPLVGEREMRSVVGQLTRAAKKEGGATGAGTIEIRNRLIRKIFGADPDGLPYDKTHPTLMQELAESGGNPFRKENWIFPWTDTSGMSMGEEREKAKMGNALKDLPGSIIRGVGQLRRGK